MPIEQIAGTLLSSSEVLEELKDDDIAAWGKQRKEAFLPLTFEIQKKTTGLFIQKVNWMQ